MTPRSTTRLREPEPPPDRAARRLGSAAEPCFERAEQGSNGQIPACSNSAPLVQAGTPKPAALSSRARSLRGQADPTAFNAHSAVGAGAV